MTTANKLKKKQSRSRSPRAERPLLDFAEPEPKQPHEGDE